MAVDDAGGGRVERGDAGEARLQMSRLVPLHPGQPLDTVGEAAGQDRFEGGALLLTGGDDELAAEPVGHAVAVAERDEAAAALDAVAGTDRTRRVVHPAMDHLGAAGRDARADALGRLGDDHRSPAQGQRPRDREPDHSRSDDERFHASPRVADERSVLLARVSPCCRAGARGAARRSAGRRR